MPKDNVRFEVINPIKFWFNEYELKLIIRLNYARYNYNGEMVY